MHNHYPDNYHERPSARLRCPYCRAPMTPAQKTLTHNPFFPFCSERCKLADLHKWLCGEYAIEQPLSELTPEQLDDLPQDEPHNGTTSAS